MQLVTLVTVKPWGLSFGIFRSAVAISLLVTLVVNPSSALFSRIHLEGSATACVGVAKFSLFCLTPPDSLPKASWVVIAILAVVASGYKPAWTSIPLAYVALSINVAATLVDGGEQVAAALVLLTLPAGLTDPRAWHWGALPRSFDLGASSFRIAVATTSIWAARVQVAIIYFFACIEKFENTSWVEGTAIYYWFRHPNFGVPGWSADVLLPLSQWAPMSAAISWGTLALEMALALSLFFTARVRVAWLLPAATIFHFSIALFMGITSFATIMIGAAVILLVPQNLAVVRRFPSVTEDGLVYSSCEK